MKDTKTVLLLMLSIGLVSTWVYHIYDKSKRSDPIASATPVHPQPDLQILQDSLQNVYALTVQRLAARLDSVNSTADQLQVELNSRLDEINFLKKEIDALLQKNGTSRQDMELARKKTSELQRLVADLGKNNKMASKTQLAQANEDFPNTPGKNQQNDMRTGKQENNYLPATANGSSLFSVSDIRFTPIMLKDDREVETNLAENINKLVISFAVQDKATSYNNAEVFAIITQPDGKVMQTDAWDVSLIPTHDFGRTAYTRKMKFDYLKGETKQLQATIKPEEYEKGNYTLKVFQNGYMIGKTEKILN